MGDRADSISLLDYVDPLPPVEERPALVLPPSSQKTLARLQEERLFYRRALHRPCRGAALPLLPVASVVSVCLARTFRRTREGGVIY